MISRSRELQFMAVLLGGVSVLAAQSKRPEDLAVGRILVAPRRAADTLFSESVILLVRYNEAGALGLMVNRKSTVPISEALREVEGASAHSDPVFVGGPVGLNTVFALARASHKPEGATDVSGDIYFITAQKALETALAEGTNPSRLRICLGYCGWGPRQLENEVSHGGWYIFSHEGDLAFDAKPATLWPRLIGRADDQTARLDFAWPAR